MAFVLKDRIKETTTTTGAGSTYALGGAVTGFETFSSNLSNGDFTHYCCTDGTDFEVGTGVYVPASNILLRGLPISSSNSNNLVNWSSGTKTIFCTVPADRALVSDGSKVTLPTGDSLSLTSTSTNSVAGPTIELKRNSSSPVDNDSLGVIEFEGKNDNDEEIDYATIIGQIADVTDGTEDGRLLIQLETNSSLTDAYAFDTDKFQLKNEQKIQWENHAGTSFEVNLVAGTPSADRTITLPDVTGSVLLDSNSIGGVKLLTTTISDDATVSVSSTYITDTYDYYDVIFHDLVPSSDGVFLQARFGVSGSVDSGSNYGYLINMVGNKSTDSNEFNQGADNSHTSMLLTVFSGIGLLGTGTGEVWNGHYRFYNLRSTNFFKGLTNMDSFGFMANEYFATIRKGLHIGVYNANRTNKVDTMEFSMSSGNIASGTMTVYGYKK